MAIYTPRGMKIRIDVSYAFGLMARLHPRVSPFRVLKTTEGIELLPNLLSFAAGIIAFIMQLPPLQIGLAVGSARLLGTLINLSGFHFIPGLIPLGTLYSYISGYGLFPGTIIVVGFVLSGWLGVLAYFIGAIGGLLTAQSLDFWHTWRRYKGGVKLTSSEANFFSAYRVHASRIGVTIDLDLSDEELDENYWGSTFEDLAIEWPTVVQRFTND